MRGGGGTDLALPHVPRIFQCVHTLQVHTCTCWLCGNVKHLTSVMQPVSRPPPKISSTALAPVVILNRVYKFEQEHHILSHAYGPGGARCAVMRCAFIAVLVCTRGEVVV